MALLRHGGCQLALVGGLRGALQQRAECPLLEPLLWHDCRVEWPRISCGDYRGYGGGRGAVRRVFGAASEVALRDCAGRRGGVELGAGSDFGEVWRSLAGPQHDLLESVWDPAREAGGVLRDGFGADICGSQWNGGAFYAGCVVACAWSPCVCELGRRGLSPSLQSKYGRGCARGRQVGLRVIRGWSRGCCGDSWGGTRAEPADWQAAAVRGFAGCGPGGESAVHGACGGALCACALVGTARPAGLRVVPAYERGADYGERLGGARLAAAGEQCAAREAVQGYLRGYGGVLYSN